MFEKIMNENSAHYFQMTAQPINNSYFNTKNMISELFKRLVVML